MCKNWLKIFLFLMLLSSPAFAKSAYKADDFSADRLYTEDVYLGTLNDDGSYVLKLVNKMGQEGVFGLLTASFLNDSNASIRFNTYHQYTGHASFKVSIDGEVVEIPVLKIDYGKETHDSQYHGAMVWGLNVGRTDTQNIQTATYYLFFSPQILEKMGNGHAVKACLTEAFGGLGLSHTLVISSDKPRINKFLATYKAENPAAFADNIP